MTPPLPHARRIHVFGASGSGVTTLGRALANALAAPSHDTDDYFWEPTDPPYTTNRPVEERLTLMQQLFLPRPDWVLSGSLIGWGDPLIPHFDAVIFVRLPLSTRLARLRDRETLRYGKDALKPGGTHHQAYSDFMTWAESYDDPYFSGRSLMAHRDWLATLPCPVLEVDTTPTTTAVLEHVLSWLRSLNATPGVR
ncbi:MAG: adenylate kinase [Paracoccaceae bacterium]